jgi:hypothetical protein
MKVQRGSICILILIVNLGSRRGWVVNATPRPLYPWERAPVPIVEEAGWETASFWTGVERRKSLAPTGVGIPDRHACSKSLYRLRQSKE